MFSLTKGVEICPGAYGPSAVLTASWAPGVTEHLHNCRIAELEVNYAKGCYTTDLSFLRDLPDLQRLSITNYRITDLEPIHALHRLRSLDVSTYCSSEIRFGEFPELEAVGLEWRRKAKSLFECRTLKSAFINHYKGQDLTALANLENLERLALLTSPIKSLKGIEALQKLRSIRLGNLTRLESIAGIEDLSYLEELDVDTCRRVNSISNVAPLGNLKNLFFNNMGDIDSIKFLDNMPSLEWILFCESSNVLDGDLSPLTRLTNLSRLSFQDRKHYSHRRDQLVAYTDRPGEPSGEAR
ncbi:MAG TPA: hypothetical protein VG944_08385 [Fimbriimonas sp.]|nr:hypothetical protein [Fimbriimonas sp.]